MISTKQLKANQENARLGGVKTDTGKAVSRFNSQTHGIMRQTIAESERTDYEAISLNFIDKFNPDDVIEKILVERLSLYYLKLLRIQKAESRYIKTVLNSSYTQINLETRSQIKPNIDTNDVDILCNIYSRYETTNENKFLRILHELERIQMGSFGENSHIIR